MSLSRRELLRTTAAGIAAVSLPSAMPIRGFAASESGIKGVGTTDWAFDGIADPSVLEKVEKANLNALQVSVGSNPDSIPLRKNQVRDRYRELSKKYDVTISSIGAGLFLNRRPLFSDPLSALSADDAIEAAAALGADNILLPFFLAADLRKKDEHGKYVDQKEGKYASYKLNEKAVQKLVNILKQLAPRAENAGVDIGLENTLTARQNVDIIDRVGSDRVTVYYDVGNSTHFGYNVAEEIRYLGNDRICEVHVKDRKGSSNLRKKGEVNFNRVADALHDIKYDGWLILETGGSIQTHRDNGAYLRNMFGID